MSERIMLLVVDRLIAYVNYIVYHLAEFDQQFAREVGSKLIEVTAMIVRQIDLIDERDGAKKRATIE